MKPVSAAMNSMFTPNDIQISHAGTTTPDSATAVTTNTAISRKTKTLVLGFEPGPAAPLTFYLLVALLEQTLAFAILANGLRLARVLLHGVSR
jgi:hypothetical protein